MYVSCDGGCIPLPLGGLTPPLDAIELIRPEHKPKRERSEAGGVETLEGGDADEDSPSLIHVGVPLEAVLRDLWTGGPDDG